MLDREKWLRERRTGIGASEIAAVLGLSRFKTALQIYKEKVGELSPDDEMEERPLLRRGTAIQRIIVDEYIAVTGAELVAYEPEIIRHPDHDFLLASLDAVVKNTHGETWNVDAKSVDSTRAKDWGEEDSDSLPDDYFYQGHAQNFISGRFKTEFAVELGGRWPLRIYTVPRDEEFFELLLGDLARFWWHVINRREPPLDFAHATAEKLMRRLHPDVDLNRSIELPASMIDLVERRELLKEFSRAADARIKALTAEILFSMQNAALATIQGSPVVLRRKPVRPSHVEAFDKAGYVRLDTKLPKDYDNTTIKPRDFQALIEGGN